MTTSTKPQWLLGAMLAMLMAATRSHHFATPLALPDASWAVFFLAGAWLGSARWLLGLLTLAVAVDAVAIGIAGVPGYCVTPAYSALLVTYSLLWAGGRRIARHDAITVADLGAWAVAVVVAAFVAELCSSGSFYFFGGRFADPTLQVFIQRELAFFPPTLGAMAFYVAAARVVQVLATEMTRRSGEIHG